MSFCARNISFESEKPGESDSDGIGFSAGSLAASLSYKRFEKACSLTVDRTGKGNLVLKEAVWFARAVIID